jgi:O-antigen/teichoic acid export membrane protein
MIGYLINLENVAFYTLAFYIGNAIAVPGRSVITISVPLLSKAWENQDLKEISTIYSKSSINQLIVSGFLFLLIWLNLQDLFTLLPEKFTHGKWVVFYIGLAQLINMGCGVNGAIIVNSDYYKFDLYTNVFLLFVTITSNLLLIPKYGIDGAAMATALSLILFNLIRVLLIYIKMGIQPFSYKTILSLCLLFFTYVICVNVPSTSNVFIDILLKSLVAILIFIPLCFKLNLSVDLNNLFKQLLKRFI